MNIKTLFVNPITRSIFHISRSVRHVPVSEGRAMDRVKRQFSVVLDSAISSGSVSFTLDSISSVFSGSSSYESTQPSVIYKLQ